MTPQTKLLGMAVCLALSGSALSLCVQQIRIERANRRADIATQEARQLNADLNDARENPVVITKYVDRVREIRVKGDTIVKEVPVYVTSEADAACTVPVGFVRLHDAAAANTTPDDPSDADARPAGIALSTVAATVTENYTAYHELVAQFNALRDKLRSSACVSIDEDRTP